MTTECLLLNQRGVAAAVINDKRGTGLSDQSTNMPTLEQRMDDVRAVMEAVHSERAVVFGMSEGGNMAMLFGIGLKFFRNGK